MCPQRGYSATQIEINHNDISRFSHSLSVSTRDTLDTDTPQMVAVSLARSSKVFADGIQNLVILMRLNSLTFVLHKATI
jgi:hypothetical protein